MSASAQTNWVVWLSSSPTLLTTASSRELTKAAMQNKSRFTLKLQTSSISRLTGDRNIVVDLEQMIILDASAAVDSPFYDAASSPPLAPLKTRPCDAVENAIELTRREAQARGIFHIRGVLFDERVLRSVPRCWSAMTPRSGPMLFDEPENEATFQYVRAAMCLRGNRFEVTRVQRVQHLPLWSRYESARKEICERDDDNPFASSASGGRAAQARGNERWLFHGTRDTTPRQITHDGDGGFDMRLSNGLYYGKGLYFTESPKYAHHYRYDLRRADGDDGSSDDDDDPRIASARGGASSVPLHQMFLASVLCGQSKDFAKRREPGLKRAPMREDGSTYLYDSVTGAPDGGRSRMHVVFKNEQAFPRFLITYRVRDPLNEAVELHKRGGVGGAAASAAAPRSGGGSSSSSSSASASSSSASAGGVLPPCAPARASEIDSPTVVRAVRVAAFNRLKALRTASCVGRDAAPYFISSVGVRMPNAAPPPPPTVARTPIYDADVALKQLMMSARIVQPAAARMHRTAFGEMLQLTAEEQTTLADATKPPAASTNWQWEEGATGSEDWKYFSAAVASALDVAMTTGQKIVTHIRGGTTYSIDIATMQQTNTVSSFVRRTRPTPPRPNARKRSRNPFTVGASVRMKTGSRLPSGMGITYTTLGTVYAVVGVGTCRVQWAVSSSVLSSVSLSSDLELAPAAPAPASAPHPAPPVPPPPAAAAASGGGRSQRTAPPAAPGAVPLSVWEWEDGSRGSGDWKAYDAATDALLVGGSRFPTSLQLTVRRFAYTVDFAALTQTKSATGFVRNIRRRASAPAAATTAPPPSKRNRRNPAPAPPAAGSRPGSHFEWEEGPRGSGDWRPYSSTDDALLYAGRNAGTFNLNNQYGNYVVDFGAMTQTNQSTGFVRNVRAP